MKLAVAAGLVALVTSPLNACRSDETYRFGAEELRSAVEGSWVLVLPATLDSPRRVYTFGITARRMHRPTAARSLVPSAHACGTRSLIAAASACISDSVLPLEIAAVDGDGSISVEGYTFDSARLDITIDAHRVLARILPDGTITDASEGATLERLASRS